MRVDGLVVGGLIHTHRVPWARLPGLELVFGTPHAARPPATASRLSTTVWARVVQRLLALNAAIWFNWQIGAPVKRS